MRTFFKWEQPSRVETAKARKAAEEQQQREVYRQVDARDKGRCRACGKPCSAYAITLLEKAHRHHIVYRSQLGGTTSQNIATLCPTCHSDVHAAKLAVEGNADVALTFSRRDEQGGWFVSKQEREVGVYERD